MLKLMTCPRGHFWEWDASSPDTPPCPQCGAPADSLPGTSFHPAFVCHSHSSPLFSPLINAA